MQSFSWTYTLHYFPYISIKLGIHLQQAPIPNSQIAQDVLDQTQMIYQDEEMLCKRASKTMLITTKRPTLQNSKKQNVSMFYCRQPIINGVKFLFANSVGLGRIILKMSYKTTIFWYAKLAPRRGKCLTVCDCVISHPNNPYAIYKSRLKNGNVIQK